MAAIAQLVADGRPGGGTTVVLTLSRLLAGRGHQVTVFGQRGSYLIDEARSSGLAVRELDFSSRLSTPVTSAVIRRQLRDLRPDVMHAHGARAALPALLAARSLRTAGPAKTVYTVHGFHFVAKRPVVRRLARAAEAMCMALADATTFVSDGDRALAVRHGLLPHASHEVTIKNAVAVDETLAASPKQADIAFLGRLTHQKNPLLVADVLAAMLPRRPTLRVIGGGPLEPPLRERLRAEGVAEQVTLHGECSRDEALRLAAGCRLLLLTSRWEGHPIALIEAMHLGLPAVASRVSGTDEIVLDGETGHLVPADDAAAYAACLALLLDDPSRLQQMRDDAIAIARRDHSAQRMLGAYLHAYGLPAAAPQLGAVPAMR